MHCMHSIRHFLIWAFVYSSLTNACMTNVGLTFLSSLDSEITCKLVSTLPGKGTVRVFPPSCIKVNYMGNLLL